VKRFPNPFQRTIRVIDVFQIVETVFFENYDGPGADILIQQIFLRILHKAEEDARLHDCGEDSTT
jgi:hypothetical protein